MGKFPSRQWDTSPLPNPLIYCDIAPVTRKASQIKIADTPLAREVHRRMLALDLDMKSLSEKAGLGETYVRDILKGRSKSPQLKKFAALADALGCHMAILLVAAMPEAGELVDDAEERALLSAWRQLPEDDQTQVAEFVQFRLARLHRPTAAGGE